MRRHAGVVLVLVIALGLLVPPGASAAPAGRPRPITPAPSSAAVRTFAISPDGQWVVYSGDFDTDGQRELYTVGIDGGTPVKLNDTLGTSRVDFFRISPDGSRVVFEATDGTGIERLWSVPLTGGPAVDLTDGNPLDSIDSFDIAADSSRVVYVAIQSGIPAELWSAPIDGTTAPAPLAVGLGPTAAVGFFEISPDSTTVVFRGDLIVDDMFELFSVDISGVGGGLNVVNDPIAIAAGDVDFSFAISPDSRRVVYIADDRTDGVPELLSAPVAGGGSVRLNGTLASGRSVQQFRVTPDGTRVIYQANERTRGSLELFSAPIDGSTPRVRISRDPRPRADAVLAEITADSSTAIYTLPGAGRRGVLYRVPVAGGASTPLAEPTSGFPSFAVLTDDGRYVVYSVQDADLISRVFAVALDGRGEPRELSPTLAPAAGAGSSGVTFFSLAEGDDRVVMIVARPDGTAELWSAAVAGGSPVRLDRASTGLDTGAFFRIAPGGQRVVFSTGFDASFDLVAPLQVVDASVRCGGALADLVGTPGADVLVGSGRSDVIVALGGADTVRGGGGNDIICAGPGADTVAGGRGRDTVRGNAGDDLLRGGAGGDGVFGDRGRDRLFGDAGPDSLVGGAGPDTCDSGTGPVVTADCEVVVD